MKLELARVGAVRRAACAEPICGAESWQTTRRHRRWSEYGGAARSCIGRGTAAGGLPHQEGGRVWNWGVRPGGPEAGTGRRLQDGHPGLVGWKVAVGDEAGACAGGSSSASSLRGADLRGELAVLTAAEVADELAVHGGSDDGGARGGRGGRESCSGATTTARRRGGRLRQRRLGGARRPRPGRRLRGRAGGLPSHGRLGFARVAAEPLAAAR